ncbi:DEAD/DEAH box helicase [Pandoraea nosoerga]|uniref:DEAD-box ATP-dependent RNA helicase RhpA n=1 Tax=Pandoraea nosoerga TaxID=2508296 RepID=A0A5E4W7Z6_9BURK|nr:MULTISPECIES: DEAD/DEAH box helicase [Pandoraea]MBN4665867.1 DEAD/DEAH box helicase [Pandoraea nosoerga]MBN4676041.1 DEAD/DEAH box helicase [Pandoraea nosoerga]MBN4681912.1 DEAD/DEAH box helicase [Pandoraea nosoerga]MBN4745090.1 DEAD/DEAH box helicase [Pandoraea nosoerga]VVE20842.1 ATP-dependent RNA helicase RhlE [Pandoraea nosoerga]
MADVNAVPTPGFDSFGLHADILRAIAEQGYTQPTPIQAQAIPVVLSGRDVMGAAQTGTGKTASFSLPIIQRLLPDANTSASPARHPVRALILTPTRELADQVADNVRLYAAHTPLRNTVVFGGVDMNPQKDVLRRGVEILIATPGRLLDHVEQKTVNLSQVKMLVLDEADRMLDMGFLPDLQRILNLLPKQRQTLLFSATFSNEIKKLASSYLTNPVTIEVARRNATADTVEQVVYEVDEDDKRAAVVQILNERDLKQVIVFVNSKIGASRLARQLERDGIVTAAIHGDKSQNERMQALEAFKQGGIRALVATDVAARGLDISDLPGVINYDLPYNPEDYVHRIGRTGRAGASGEALSLCAPDERKQLVEIEKLIKRELKRGELVLERRSRSRDDRGDRYERSERHARHEGLRASRGGSAAPRRVRPEDEFFYKPYEPSPSAGQSQREAQPDAGAPAAFGAIPEKAPKRQVAALLAGFPRKAGN